jgi:acyl-coenzyme A thioesterase PaaI-like protein
VRPVPGVQREGHHRTLNLVCHSGSVSLDLGWDVDPELREAFQDLAASVRRLQNAMSAARPTVSMTHRATDAVLAAIEILEPFAVDEPAQLAGRLDDVAGRAQTLVPPVHLDVQGPDGLQGRVTFTRFHLGGGGAAHGGTLPLVFDEVLGRLAGAEGRGPSRTAFLHVNYRAITPLDVELQLRARVSGIEGRKIWVVGTLHDSDRLLCDAEALFVILKPGQP